MRLKFVLATCSFFVGAWAFAADTSVDIKAKTDALAPEVATANVRVRPGYLLDPDGSGEGVETPKDANLMGRWDFEDESPQGPYACHSSVSGPVLTRQTSGENGGVSIVRDGVSNAISLNGSDYVSGIFPSNNVVGTFTVSLWFKINSSNEDFDFKTLFRIDRYFGLSEPCVVAYKKQATSGVGLQEYITIRSIPTVLINEGGKSVEKLQSAIYDNPVTWNSAGNDTVFFLNFPVSGTTLKDGKWHHLIVTYDKSIATITANENKGGPFHVYLDGVKNNAGAAAPLLTTQISTESGLHPYKSGAIIANPGKLGSCKIYLGYGADYPSPSNYFGGFMDRVRVLRVALSGAEVATLFDQDVDGDLVSDRTEVNQGTSPLDPNSNSLGPGINDDDNLNSAPASKKLLGKWDFETLNKDGKVENLAPSAKNRGHLTLGGATLDNGNGMPSRSARFYGGSRMIAENLNWGEVGNYSGTCWFRFQEGSKLATTYQPVVLWSLDGINGVGTRLLLTVMRLSNGTEQFVLKYVNYQVTPASIEGYQWTSNEIIGLADGGWHHLGLIRDTSIGYSLYIDGESMGRGGSISSTSSGGWQKSIYSASGARLEVGGTSATFLNHVGFEGNMDRLRFWGAALNAKDLSNLYLQDYDGDTIPDIAEIGDSSLNALEKDFLTTIDSTVDQDGIAGTGVNDPTTGLVAHWNFESLKYDSFGRYFANEVNSTTLRMSPNTGVALSISEPLASYFASFRGNGNAEVVLGSTLATNPTFSVSGWFKLDNGSIWDVPGVRTPFWEIRNYKSEIAQYDSMRLHALRTGAYTMILLSRFNPDSSDPEMSVVKWIVPRGVRIDNEGWHHLVFQREGSGAYELYLDSVKLGKYSTDLAPENFTNTLDTDKGGTLFRIGTSTFQGVPYGLKGGWDRIRIYTKALSPSLIHALYGQDADGDGTSDLNESGLIGRDPTKADADDETSQNGDLANVDVEGLPKSLAIAKETGLLGLWDFENLNDRGVGFAELTTRGHAMLPQGAARQVGLDYGSGMPSRSAFCKDGGFLTSKVPLLDHCQEFSTSLWVKTEAGLISQQPSGFAIVSFEDAIAVDSLNTLTLRVRKTGASQALIVQGLNTRGGFLQPGGDGIAWSLLNRPIDDGKWHHIAWVRYKQGSALYVDGKMLDRVVGDARELVASLNSTAINPAKIVVGRTSMRAPELALQGNVDRLRFYGRSLKQAEVKSLYGQDFDKDGFSDIQELESLGFDPFHAPATDTNPVDWDDDTGITSTEAASLLTGLVGAWGFESVTSRIAGDSSAVVRFPTEKVEGAVNDAIADGGVQWNSEGGMLSKSLGLSRGGYLSLPAEALGESGDSLSVSFWLRLAQDEISNQAAELQHSLEKLALFTFGTQKSALPKVVVSVDHQHQLVAETRFELTGQAGKGYVTTEIGRWDAPAKLDDGRWHHVVINLKGNASNIWVDGFKPDNIAATTGNFPGYMGLKAENGPYLWMGYRKNELLDPNNLLASNLLYRGFAGSLDRVRLYKRLIKDSEIEAIYGQDRDNDTIPDVTEVNSGLDPFTHQDVVTTGDYDLDGLTNAEEDQLGSSWWQPDSDGDWLWDGWEQKYDSTPDSFKPLRDDRAKRDEDQDGDTLTAMREFLLGTNPDDGDSDDDGASDLAEFQAGYDPLDSANKPGAGNSGSAMTNAGILPGGILESAMGGEGSPSYSFNGQDATGPRYRKISLNGRPMADEAPQAEDETDRHKEETYVDAFSLGLHHDTSLVYVPVPSSDLVLQVNMSLRGENWNNRSGIRPLEKLTSPFGPCWESNVCAYIEETSQGTGAPQIESTTDPKYTYSVSDEDGRSLRFGSYDGASIFAYPGSLSDRKSYQHKLRRSALTTLVLEKKFGTTLTYERVALDQVHATNRAGRGNSYLLHRYYRLTRVRDRYGNELVYAYPNAKTLIPNRISVANRPELAIEIQVDPEDPHRVKSVKDPRGYEHSFGYASLQIPNGQLCNTPSVKMLATVRDPLQQTITYGYASSYENDYVNRPSSLTHYFNIDLSSITNKRGVVTAFSYEADDDKFSSTVQDDGNYKIERIYGLPKLVKTVRSASSMPSTGIPGGEDAEQIAEFARKPGLRWLYTANGLKMTSGGNQFIPTNEWSNDVRNAVGRETTYTFRDIETVLADTGVHGSSLSLNWLVYYLEMDIIHPDSIGTEVYKFDLASGLALSETRDICGNITAYRYNDNWGGFSLMPSSFNRLALFSKWSDPSEKVDALARVETYAYSGFYRVMESHVDVYGTRKQTQVDDKGRRRSLEVFDASGTLLSRETYTYDDPNFPAFMTRKVVRAFENKSGQEWEQDLSQVYEADANGRVKKEAVDMNRDGKINAGDLITSYAYDKNGNKTSATDARSNSTDFVYDPLNQLVMVTYPAADGGLRSERRSKINLYDANGNKHAVKDENGNYTLQLFDPLNRVHAQIRKMSGASLPVTSPATNMEGAEYLRLTAEGGESADDLVTRFTYNDVNSVVKKTDPRLVVTKTVYDAIERPVSVWENFVEGDDEGSFAASNEKTLTYFEYDKTQNTGGSIFASDGFKPTKTIRKAAVRREDGSYGDIVTTHAYDAVYRPLNESVQYEADKSVVQLTEYRDAQRQVLKTVAYGEPHARTTLTQMDGLGREIQVIDNYGGLNATTRKFYSSTGLAYKTIDPLGREAESDFDAAGRAVKLWQARSDLAPGAAGFGKVDRTASPTDGVIGSPVTVQTFDANGNVTSVKNAREFETTTTYDARNRKIREESPAVDADGDPATTTTEVPVTETWYDGVGNVICQKNPRGHFTRTFYDEANRVWFTRANTRTGVPSDVKNPSTNNPGDVVTENTYDKGGNVLSVKDGNGNFTRNTYNALNRLVATATNPGDGQPSSNPVSPNSGDITVFNEYDDAGNLTQVTDGKGQKTAFRYDGLGRKTRTIWDFGTSLVRTEQFEFDGVVQTARIDAKGQHTEYEYDGLHRNKGVAYPSRPADNRTHEFDLAGNLLSVTYPNETDPRKVTQTYDALNRVRTEVSNGQTHAYTYDKVGNRLTVTYQGGRYLASTYDALNRLETCTEKENSAAPTSNVTRYGYDLAGNVLRKVLPNGVTTFTTYDAANRKLLMEDKSSAGAVISSFAYGPSSSSEAEWYDKVGNVLQVQETYADPDIKNRTVYNAYDRVYRLRYETLDESGTGGTLTVTHYAYDAANNRTEKTKRINGGLAPADDLVFTFGDGSSASTNTNQLTGYGPRGSAQTHTFSYDLNGNRASHSAFGRSDVYTYDCENRLVSLNFQTGETAARRGTYNYVYDHRTRRVVRDEQLAGGTLSNVSFSGGLSVQERSDGSLTRQYVRGSDWGGGIGGILYSLDKDGVSAYNHYNSRGDVIGQTGGNGTVTWQASYEAFGMRVREDGVAAGPQKANTKDEDPTGLLNEGMRYRDLESGVFITRDPAGFVDGPNVYTYVRQNPWTGFDPDGLDAVLYVRDKEQYDRIKKIQGNGDAFYKGADVRFAPDDKDGNKHPVFSGKLTSVSVDKRRYDKGAIIGEKGAWFIDNKDEFEARAKYFQTVAGAAIVAQGIGMATASGAHIPAVSSSVVTPMVTLGGNSAKATAQVTAVEAQAVTKTVPNTTLGWKTGEPINNLTAAGNVPKWSTVRQRFWKNEAFGNPEAYSASNLERMQKGLAPQRLNPTSGRLESMELHHTPAQRDGGLFDVQKVWPEEHAVIDPFRKTGN